MILGGAARRDRLGPDHLVRSACRAPRQPRADGRLRRRGDRQGRLRRAASCAAGSSRSSSSSSRRCWACCSRSASPSRSPGCAPERAARAGGPGLPAAPAPLGRALLAEPRRQRRAEDDGDHRGAAGVDPGAVRRHQTGWLQPLPRLRTPTTFRSGWSSAAYTAIGLGTALGGWRIVKTMGSRITKLRPFGGFCAETAGGISHPDRLAASGVPVSTTHTITGAIVGVGAAQRVSAVRWGVATRIVWAWILTIPMSAGDRGGVLPDPAEVDGALAQAAAGRRPCPRSASGSPSAAGSYTVSQSRSRAVASAPSASRRRSAASVSRRWRPSAMAGALSGSTSQAFLPCSANSSTPPDGRHQRRQPRAHRLQQRVAERLGGRGKGEDVGRGVGRRERLAVQQAGDVDARDLAPPDLVLQRPPPHQDQLRRAPLRRQRLPRLAAAARGSSPGRCRPM